MKRLIGMMGMMGLMGLMGLSANAVSFQPLSINEAAAAGATHEAVITWQDMPAATATNTAATVNITGVPSNCAVTFVAAIVTTPWATGNTNFTGSSLLTVQDTNGTTFVSGVEMNADGPPTCVALPGMTSISYTTNLVLQTANIASNGAAVVTNIVRQTGTFAGLTTSGHYYTAASKLQCVVTPNGNESVSSLTQGETHIYFRIRP